MGSRQSNNNKLMANVRIFLTSLIMLAGLVLGDHLLGYINDTGQIREAARKFRSEVAYLPTFTRNMVPSIDHDYPPAYRSPESGIPHGAPRKFRTNAHGIIEPVRLMDNTKTKILFLGGSTTEANEVDEPFRSVFVAEEALIKAGLDVAAINGGVRGHTTQDSINAFLNRRLFRQADVIVMVHNINDRLVLARRSDYHANLGLGAPTSWRATIESLQYLLKATWDFLSYRSNSLFLIRHLKSRFDPWTGEAIGNQDKDKAIEVKDENIDFGAKFVPKIQPKFEQNLRIFVGIVRALNKYPILMTQPLGTHSKPQSEFNNSIRKVAKELGVTLIDLEQALPEDRSWAFLSDNIHFNNQGSKAIGQIIAVELARVLGGHLDMPHIETGNVNIDDLLTQCQDDIAESQQKVPRRLLGDVGRYPSFSPDGRWLLYHNWAKGYDRIKAYDLQHGKLIKLSPKSSKMGERHPTFLNVGEDEFEIVFGQGFIESTKSFERLMVRHWPSLETRELIVDPSLGGAIATVKGDHVYFAGFERENPKRPPDIYKFDTSTANLTQLTNSRWEEWRPTIAPDGTVYFIANNSGDFDIYRLSPDADQPTVFNRSDADEWDPAVSPDGRWVAFASKRYGSWDIFVASVGSPSKMLRITDLASEEWDPTWHPSGKILAFARKQGGISHIYGVCFNEPD